MKAFKLSQSLIFKSLFLTSLFFFISTNASAQSVADRIYSRTEVGDYRNYCEYGDMEFFIPDRNRSLISINNNKATTGNMILGCWPLSYNSNGMFYNYIKMDLLPGRTECPHIELNEAFPVGAPTPTYEFMNLTPQSYQHRPSATVYIPRMNGAFNRGNSCYYSYGAQGYVYGGDKKEYMAYFFIDIKQLKDFVKGDKYAERYAGRFVPGASWEGSTIEESTQTYYNLPKMQLSSPYHVSDKYNVDTDFNMNRGKYIATSSREVSDKQELDNVIFFPGLLGSQLQNSYTNQIIWPSITKDIHSNMKVVNPESIHSYSLSYPFPSNVYTYNDIKSKQDGGVLRNYFLSTNGGTKINTVDIYDSFLTELDKLKANNEMRDYAAIPYDFRMFTEDIYCSSNVLAGKDKVSYDTQSYGAYHSWPWDCRKGYIYGEMKRLALSSKTGKITLIGHSYGGLVMKEILKHLEETNDSLLSKIDKVILVAVPQGGASESVVNMLHGKDMGVFGKPLNASEVRQMSITFPSAYQLLPSEKLLNKIKTESSTPLITFANKSLNGVNSTTSPNAKQYTKYGESIDNYAELYDYITNKEGRPLPAKADLNSAQIGHNNLIYYAKALRDKLDNYVPTSTIDVHQIAGWGIPTDIGYSYDYIDGCLRYAWTASSSPLVPMQCIKYGMNKQLNVTHSIDGDDTVPTASALWMSTTTNSNVHNWWVDLAMYNASSLFGVTINRSHKDIFASMPALNKVLNLIRGKDGSIQYISNTTPLYTDRKNYITYSVHSPVNMTITDSKGNISGYNKNTDTIVNNINDVYYEQIGDTKIIIAPLSTNHIVNLTGYDNGVYTLNINSYDNDKEIATTTYYSIPVATNSQSYLKHDILAATTDLLLDYNNNGLVDVILNTSKTNNKVSYVNPITVKETIKVSDYLTFATTTPSNDGPRIPSPTIIDDIIKKPISTEDKDVDIKLIKRRK